MPLFVALLVMVLVSSTSSTFVQSLFRGRPLHLLRDDLFSIGAGLRISGNKARKFRGLNVSSCDAIVSYGGAQSNSMAALSTLAHENNRRFVYYTTSLPSFLKTSTAQESNFATAVSNGMELVEIRSDEYAHLAAAPKHTRGFPDHALPLPAGIKSSENLCWVPQGGACPEAESGCIALAAQVAEYITAMEQRQQQQERQGAQRRRWLLVMASGTGTTALFTSRSLQTLYPDVPCSVVAVPCAGSGADLLQQMEVLDRASGGAGRCPDLLEGENTSSSSRSSRVFAKPNSEHLLLWKDLCSQLCVPFDLVYTPRAFEQLLESAAWMDQSQTEIIYYCCGGAEGNLSQLARYKRAGLHV